MLAAAGVEHEGVSQLICIGITETLPGRGGVSKLACCLVIVSDGDQSLFPTVDIF